MAITVIKNRDGQHKLSEEIVPNYRHSSDLDDLMNSLENEAAMPPLAEYRPVVCVNNEGSAYLYRNSIYYSKLYNGVRGYVHNGYRLIYSKNRDGAMAYVGEYRDDAFAVPQDAAVSILITAVKVRINAAVLKPRKYKYRD